MRIIPRVLSFGAQGRVRYSTVLGVAGLKIKGSSGCGFSGRGSGAGG